MAHYRQHPADNIISNLVEASEGDDSLEDPEIVANCVLFLFGGHETTTNLIGNGIRVLLNHPGQLQKLRDDLSDAVASGRLTLPREEVAAAGATS